MSNVFRPANPVPSDPADVIAIEFDDPLLAQEALLATTRLSKRGSLELADAVIVNKIQGKTRITQTKEMAPAQAAWMGSWMAGITGLLIAGTTGWLVGIALGALGGWLWASRRDVGIPNPWLEEVGRRLRPEHSATVVMLPRFHRAHLLAELRRFRGRLMYTTLPGVEAETIEEALQGQGWL